MSSSSFVSFVPSSDILAMRDGKCSMSSLPLVRHPRRASCSVLPVPMTSPHQETAPEARRGVHPVSKSENLHSRRAARPALPSNSQLDSQATPHCLFTPRHLPVAPCSSTRTPDYSFSFSKTHTAMKSFAAAAALLAVAPFAMGQQMQINSLSGVVECEPILISWTGGTPPYYLSFIPAGQPSAPAIKQFPPQQGTSYTWVVDLPSGTSFTSELKDASGQPVYSGTQTVEAGSNSDCVNTSVMESGTATGAGATTPGAAAANPTSSATQPAGASSAGASTTGATSHATAASSAASGSHSGTVASLAASGSSATPSATQNAAVRGSSVGVFGLTGILGLIGAAIF